MKTKAKKPIVPDTDYNYKVNLGKPWDTKKKPARIDTQGEFCWVVDERGYVVFSFQLPKVPGALVGHPDNLKHAKKFFAKYFPKTALPVVKG